MGKKPNIVLVMVDDMGYSDIGCFGGAIDTPNIDALGKNGIRFTQFYNTARCCPARASLLTGQYPHPAGMGWMTAADLGTPGYRGELNPETPTIPECLRRAGYATFMTGKWHVTHNKHLAPDSPKDSWPCQRGFDRYFGTLTGAENYFRPKRLFLDNDLIDPGEDFYYTDAVTDYACRFIGEHDDANPDSPFFAYVAYTAPHWPLHARPDDIEAYRGRFRDGWDVLRAEKYDRMRQCGLLDEKWGLSDRDDEVPAWESLSETEKDEFDLKMAIYAAQITAMDRGIGRIVETLKNRNMLDNTLIFFLSDNGGCHEELNRTPESSTWGTADSFVSYGRPWANLSNVPFRLFKSWVHEGGIATPLIVHWPDGLEVTDTWDRQLGHITDILPTCLAVAEASYPPPDADVSPPQLPGKSLVPSFRGKSNGRELIFLEHETNRALRKGKWKLVAQGKTAPWELYDMETDRSELHDLSADHPELTQQLAKEWNEIAENTGVFPLDDRPWGERVRNPLNK